MYTAKHASIVNDRVKDAEVYVSYIDVRAYGKSYEEFYKSTQEAGIVYIRGIPGEVTKGEERPPRAGRGHAERRGAGDRDGSRDPGDGC